MTAPEKDHQPLRRDAEKHLGVHTEAASGTRERPAEVLLHELRVHQIELEMQNEELRQAREIIEASRNRYQDLYDFAPIGYLTLSHTAEIVEANLTGADLFGMTRNELLNRPFTNCISPGDRQHWSRQFMNMIMNTADQGESKGCELALMRADGSLFQARLYCLRIEQDGEFPVARIALTDITERRLAQQHLDRLVESAMDAIISIDESQCIVLFNPAAERMFGLSAAAVLGQPIDPLLPESARHIHAEHIRGFAHTGVVSRNLENRGGLHGRRANGELFPIEASLTQVEVQGRRQFTVILRDITERKRVEQALLESQTDLNRAQSVGQIGSWRLNVLRNELLWSDENHRIFGIAKGSPLTYESFLAVVHPDDREYVDRMWETALHSAPYDIEHRLVVSGKVKWVREKAELEFDAAGQLLGAFGTTQDITELKLAEQALIDADRRKDEFLAMLGHELRNPLTPIRNAAHVLGRLGSHESQVRWAQEIIEQQVTHLTRLVDDLLDVSRIVSGKIILQQEPLSFAGMVDQALDMALPLIEAKGQKIELRLPEIPVWLRGDPVRLVQVLVNLMDNATKYTPEGGRIELAACVVEGMIEIRLCDNGIGIPGELRPHIFDLFQQGERALDRAQGGLGIGLTLTKRLVEMHGGRIEAASAGPGLGSEFTIWLPILADAAGEARDDESAGKCVPKTVSTPAHIRVLVVDDDPAVADSMAVLLAIEGHEVRTAPHGEVALELARAFHPRLVLLDIGLQGMDGYEVGRRLRAQQNPNERLCLVAVTGYGHEEARTRARDAGFDRYLVKPVFPETILELISKMGDAPTTRTLAEGF